MRENEKKWTKQLHTRKKGKRTKTKPKVAQRSDKRKGNDQQERMKLVRFMFCLFSSLHTMQSHHNIRCTRLFYFLHFLRLPIFEWCRQNEKFKSNHIAFWEMCNEINRNRCCCMLLSQLTAFYNCNTISGCVCVQSAYVAIYAKELCEKFTIFTFLSWQKRNEWVAWCSRCSVQLVHVWLDQERQTTAPHNNSNNVKWQIARRQHQRLLGWSFYGEAMVKLAAQAHAEYLQVHTFAWVYLIRARKAQTMHDSHREQRDTQDCNNNNLLIINLSCSPPFFALLVVYFFVFISSFCSSHSFVWSLVQRWLLFIAVASLCVCEKGTHSVSVREWVSVEWTKIASICAKQTQVRPVQYECIGKEWVYARDVLVPFSKEFIYIFQFANLFRCNVTLRCVCADIAAAMASKNVL